MTRSTRAFVAAALLCLPAAALLSVLALLEVPAAWPAMIHLTLFGWITGIILAVNYHTMPVFTARDFPYSWPSWVHLAAWVSGLALDVLSQLLGWTAGLSFGLALQLLAALIFVANTVLLLRGPRRALRPAAPIAGQPQIDRMGTRATKGAGLALPLALALLLAIQVGWLGSAWALAAEHLVTLGWVMLMIVGVAYHLLPRFSGRATRGAAWAGAQVACHYTALGLIVAALGAGWPAGFALGGLLMSLALGLFVWAIWPTIRAEKPREQTAGSLLHPQHGETALSKEKTTV